MTLTERELWINPQDKGKYIIEIRCDLCDLHMYYNKVDYQSNNLDINKFSLFICSICARDMHIKSLKTLQTKL